MSNQASKLLVGLTRINSNQEIAALLNFENFIKKTSSVVALSYRYNSGINMIVVESGTKVNSVMLAWYDYQDPKNPSHHFLWFYDTILTFG